LTGSNPNEELSNKACPLASAGSIICYAFYNTSSGKRRRYRCRSCGKTFCANSGTMPGPGLCRVMPSLGRQTTGCC